MCASKDTALRKILDRIPDYWGKSVYIGPGWYELVLLLDSDLSKIDPDYTIQQVKEKFGTLRFYAQPSNERFDFPEFWGLIREAEDKSGTICEECGGVSSGPSAGGGKYWIRTLCEECWLKV